MNRLRIIILLLALFGSIGIAAANLLLTHMGGASGSAGCSNSFNFSQACMRKR
jgi:hypothetical protein